MTQYATGACDRLAAGKEIIMDRWMTLACALVPAADKQTRLQLRDAIPSFISSLCEALSPDTDKRDANEDNCIAKKHGEQRLELIDYSLFEVLQEYKLLRQVICNYLEETGPVTTKERDVVLDSVEQAMIEAGSHFAKLEKTKYKQALERAEQSNSALDQVAAVAAHDLKAPLATIAGFIEVLELELGDKIRPEAAEHMVFIRAAALRMTSLVDRLLAYARMAADPVNFTPFEFSAVVDHVKSNLRSQIQESGAILEHGPLPMINGDISLMTQILQNLVTNSIKFSGSKTPVIRLDAKELPGEWLFCVTDNGLGFDMKFKDEIFGLYKRLHSGDRYTGTGIGLASARRAVEVHGGRIWAESEVGKGSVFSFTIRK